MTTPTASLTTAALTEVFFEVDAKLSNAGLDEQGRYHEYAEAVIALIRAISPSPVKAGGETT